MRYSFILLPLILLATSCNANQETTRQNKKYKVQWYAGYTMPQFLAQPVEIKSLSDINGLLDKSWYDKFHVRANDKAPVITLSSCNDYFNIKQKPLWTVKESENPAFMQIVVMCLATQAISQAQAATSSTLSRLVFDKTLPGKLPAQMAMVVSASESKRLLANKSIKHMSQVNKIVKVIQHSRFDATYIQKGQQQKLQLVAKGDFNHDGFEDYLMSSQDSVQGGTYSALHLYLITQFPGQFDYSLVKAYPY